MRHSAETLLFYTLLELAVIVVAARVGGVLARRFRQAAVVGEILVGIALGPSLFGWLAPAAFATVFRSSIPEPLQMLSGLGLVLLMFQVGMEFDFSHLRQREHRATVVRVAAASLLLPFAMGLSFGYLTAPALSPMADRGHCALFVATAFSITALPVLGRIMLELRMTRSALGVIAIGAAAVNDVVGWLLLALITMVATTGFDGARFWFRILLVALFVLICLGGVRPLLKQAIRRSKPREGRLSPNLLAGTLATVFLAAMATYGLGIFAIFGGFMIGVMLFDEPHFVGAWRQRAGDFVMVFFMPVFFTYTGLRTTLGSLDSTALAGWCAVLIALASGGKLAGAYLAARASGLRHSESAILGFMMNTRGLMELVVINAGLDLGVISQQMFTMLVLMAVVSTVVTTPVVRYYLPRVSPTLRRSDLAAT